MQDITARKRAEEALRRAHAELEIRVQARTAELSVMNEALRKNEEKYRVIVENSLDGISLVDETGVILEWNAARSHHAHSARGSGRPIHLGMCHCACRRMRRLRLNAMIRCGPRYSVS